MYYYYKGLEVKLNPNLSHTFLCKAEALMESKKRGEDSSSEVNFLFTFYVNKICFCRIVIVMYVYVHLLVHLLGLFVVVILCITPEF